MVYIFFVQSGTMMTFDNEISIMQSVADLKVKIEEKCHIPIDQQVLLINGGEPLDSKKNLCSYVAGTDSNPIYLFSTNYDVTKLDILKHMTYDDTELKQRLAEALSLSVSVTAVKIRALVAQDFYNVAKLQLDFCENMVLEQHLQQQGWSAVIANLEDIVSEFRKRWDLFQKMYEKFIADRDTYESFLLSFEEDKKILQRIPVIATLLETQKEPLNDSEISETVTSTSESEPTKEISLFDWISSSEKDSKSTLDDVYELCKANIKKFESEIMPMLRNQITDTLQLAEKQERKEIEGLGKRLMDLDDLLRKMKRNVDHQSDMAQSFLQNQNSVAHIKDTSILPDLCATHVQQLDLIRTCHQKLCDDRIRIVKAKNELSKSLCARIGWVQNVEDKIWELDSLLVYFHEHLQRLRKHLEVFQQLHLAPAIYMNAIVEVVRRRAFSQLFLTWASDLSCQQLTIHNEEVTRRKEFCALFEGHFLNALFPGMGDVPPSFATEPPAQFDTKLPKVDEEDVERLRKELPDFTDNLIVHDMSQAASFFLGKSLSKANEDKVDDSKAIEEKLIQAVSDVGLSSNLDKKFLKTTGSNSSLVSAQGLQIIKDDKGCESETDTEEFEKVGQSPLELTFPQGGAAGASTEKIDASTCTEVRSQLFPPKKPPRSFRATQSFDTDPVQRTLSISTNESFTNIKNISLDSIDELSSIRNFSSTTDSCFNSHYNQCIDQVNLLTSTSSLHLSDVTSLSMPSKSTAFSYNQTSYNTSMLSRSKSVSPQSPSIHDRHSPQIVPQQSDFATDEFYIDESLPSSVGTANSQGSEFVRQLDTANIVVAMLQDNLQISRSEHEKLKSMFVSLSDVAKMTAQNLRIDLDSFKAQFVNDSRDFSKQCEELGNSWENLLVEVDRNEKEIVESLRRENEEEKERFRYRLLEKEDIIRRLEEDKRAMEDRIEESRNQLELLETKIAQQNAENCRQIEDLKTQLREKDVEKEKCLKELGDNLKMEHRAEIDNIKSRFKLMTMERSPSLTSLEKDKSGDFTSSNLLVQMTENFELDKENAVTEERQRCEKLMEEKMKEMQLKFEQEKQLLSQDLAKRLTQEKEKQIDVLMQREKNLVLENFKFKTTIQQLTEYQEDRGDSELYEQIEKLKLENQKLQEEVLAKDRAIKPGEGSKISNKLSIDSCKTGDVVLLIWDTEHACFKVLQETIQLCFLNWDCLASLGLEITDGTPNKMHCFGEVVNLEYCETCKEVNRYNVPRGSKFYMVTVKPVADLSRSQCADEPVEVFAQTVEKQLAGDSGIVENVEQAAAADEDFDRHEEKFWSTQYIPDFYDREKQYQLEISQYKNVIKELTESQRDRNDLKVLRRDNEMLQEELAKLRNEREAIMTTSVAVCEAKLDATTSPLAISPPASDMSRSDIFIGNRPHRLCIDSCKVGNAVLVLWDQAHENFKILQESKHTYFLHSDCLDKLGLCIVDGCPNKSYCIGEVVDKEYCQTRKSENRYKVPKGTKFFRVRVKPVTSIQRDSRELAQSAYTPKQSSTMSTSQSVITTFDPLIEEPRLDDVVDISKEVPEDESEAESKQEKSEDGGIEEATVATEQSERYESESCKEMVESTYISTNWLEAMFRSVFSK